MSNTKNTFLRVVAYGSLRIMQSGEAALRTAAVLAGLVPDALSEGARQVARWTLPLDDTPISVLQYLLAQYTLPAYESESYAATLTRLQDAIPTHEVAGSVDMLEAELVRAGLISPIVTHDTTTHQDNGTFEISAYNIGPTLTWGDFAYGDGNNYGGQVDPPVARNIQRVIKAFKPLRSTLISLSQRPTPLLHAWPLDEIQLVQGAVDRVGSVNGVHDDSVTPYQSGPGSTRAVEYAGSGNAGTDLGEDVFTIDQDDEWSISVWVNTSEPNGTLIAHRNASSLGIEAYLSVGKPALLLVGSTGNVLVTGPSTVDDGVWHHVVWQWDGSEDATGAALYVDGEEQALAIVSNTMTPGGTLITSGQHGTLGARWETDAPDASVYSGRLWDASLFSRAITDDELDVIHESGLKGTSLIYLLSYQG